MDNAGQWSKEVLQLTMLNTVNQWVEESIRYRGGRRTIEYSHAANTTLRGRAEQLPKKKLQQVLEPDLDSISTVQQVFQ
ncbi:hypothetical protein E2C01_013609 [Portunus trituberculatus]|uniref:Uncharacterized protein n=1 Tax=Portunus trituberculatus TaxID=210409 RepID=A0A5B7DHR1_PORTR|nr:hypothetical protein [Portunus trituberculatus]